MINSGGPRIPGAVNEQDLSIQEMTMHGMLLGRKAIYYKDIPLWFTNAETLDQYDIFLYDPQMWRDKGEPEPYTLLCVDNLGDMFTFGSWQNKEEALAWLAQPFLAGWKEYDNRG